MPALTTQFLIGPMPFLPPNRQHQSTEGTSNIIIIWGYTHWEIPQHLTVVRFIQSSYMRITVLGAIFGNPVPNDVDALMPLLIPITIHPNTITHIQTLR